MSNVSLYGKLTYYPIGTTFLKGLNIAIGPTVGYSLFSRSAGSETSVLPNGNTVKAYYMVYDNYVLAGYKISAGYEYNFKKWLVGARLDWSNTQKGDINTMYGAKIGLKL